MLVPVKAAITEETFSIFFTQSLDLTFRFCRETLITHSKASCDGLGHAGGFRN